MSMVDQAAKPLARPVRVCKQPSLLTLRFVPKMVLLLVLPQLFLILDMQVFKLLEHDSELYWSDAGVGVGCHSW